jgi:hypothetical protein
MFKITNFRNFGSTLPLWLFVKIHVLSLLILQLEEFRKKKAAEQAKKAASASQDHAFDIRPHQKQPLATEPVRRTDSDGAGTSDEPGQAVRGPSAAVPGNDNKAIGFPFKIEQYSLNDTIVTPPFSVKYSNAHSAVSAQTDAVIKNLRDMVLQDLLDQWMLTIALRQKG